MKDKDKQSNSSSGLVVTLITIGVVVFLWVVRRVYTSDRLKSYNDCYPSSNYTVSSAVNGFKNICDSKRPPDFLIWITGVK